MPTVAQSLETLLRNGVQAALLATADGFVIDAAVRTPGSIDFTSLAADVAGIFRAAGMIGRDMGGPGVQSVVITMNNAQAVLALPVAEDAIAVVLPRRGAAAGTGSKTLEQIGAAMRHFLQLHTGKQLLDAVGEVVRDLGVEELGGPGPARRPDAMRAEPGRVALTDVDVRAVGQVVTVRVALGLGPRQAKAKAVGRDLPGQRAALAGSATIRAMLELLPAGHAVELTQLQATSPAREGLWVLTRFLSPESEQSLFGISVVREGDEATAAAKAVLNAVNRRVEALLISGAASAGQQKERMHR